MTSASARSPSASRLTVIVWGWPSGPYQSDRSSHRSSSQVVSASRSLASQGSDCQRRLHSGRSIRPIFRSPLDHLDPPRDDVPVILRPLLRDLRHRRRAVPREPLRLDLAARHLPREHDLKGPKTKIDIRNGPWLRDQASGFVVGKQPVSVVNVPVELFLQGDHPSPNAYIFGVSGVETFPGRYAVGAYGGWLDGGELPSKGIQLPAAVSGKLGANRQFVKAR